MGPTKSKPVIDAPQNGEPKQEVREAIIVQQQQPAPVIPAPTPLSVLQEAVQRGANVDTLTKLLELQERWEAGEARREFGEAFAAFKAEARSEEHTSELQSRFD